MMTTTTPPTRTHTPSAPSNMKAFVAKILLLLLLHGGLLASVKPGSAFLFEQTRLEDGIWLPRYSQVNASARVMLFKGLSINETNEFSDFKRFSTKTGEGKLDRPKEANPQP